jgi:hypothetical protein
LFTPFMGNIRATAELKGVPGEWRLFAMTAE